MVRPHISVNRSCAYASLSDELCMDAHHAEIYLKGPVNANDVLQDLLFSAMRRTALGWCGMSLYSARPALHQSETAADVYVVVGFINQDLSQSSTSDKAKALIIVLHLTNGFEHDT